MEEKDNESDSSSISDYNSLDFDDIDEPFREREMKRRRTFTKRQEVASLILLLGSITLTVLVAFGILSLGIFGTVILGATTFISLSHFMGTYIFTYDYYRGDGDNIFESVSLVKKESIINTFMCLLKFKILPIVFLCSGIIFVTLGSTGIIGLGLGLGLGIPSIVVNIFPFMHFIIKANSDDKSRYYTERCCRKWWKIMICTLGLATTITLFALCIVGTLTWTIAFPTALFAFVSAIVSFSCVMSNDLLKFRTVLEEISNPAMFFGGISINILISFGILPFGPLGIGICAMFIFIGASRFIFTNTLTALHNLYVEYDLTLGKGLSEYTAEDVLLKLSDGLVNSKTTHNRMIIIKRLIFPIVAIFTGIGMVCTVGFFGFTLSFGVGIPLLALALAYIPCFIVRTAGVRLIKLKLRTDSSDNYWVAVVGIIGFITAVTFPILSITGILAWESVIAFGAPTVIFAVLTVLFNLGISLFKNKNDDEEVSLGDNLKTTTGDDGKSLNVELIYNSPYGRVCTEEEK